MNKEHLIKKFQSNPERYWKVKLFDDLKFTRKKCKSCGKFFWTLTEQEICNDSKCRMYGFIGNPPTKKRLDFFETWKVIEEFFSKNGHATLKPYPTLCKWFPLYFNIAGIVNFYRVNEKGELEFEYPANPTIMTQPCLRFLDIPNTGINSKSYTCFFMIQQTSFYNNNKGYWKDKCIELDFELLTKVLGIKPEEIVFIEDVWVGPNAFGSSLEYHVQGLELGNAVFTEFRGTLDKYSEMEEKVIDMGAGHERFTWITQGTPTSYDAVFGPVMEKAKKAINLEYDEEFFKEYSKYTGILNVDEVSDLRNARKGIADRLKVPLGEIDKKVEEVEAFYATVEHARALLLAFKDSAIPSNVGGGYNLRVILRRALSFIDKFNWQITLEDIMGWHMDYMKKLFPELTEYREEIKKILQVEEKRYSNTKERVKKLVSSLGDRKISEGELIKLYDSEGITPEQMGVEIPPDFYVKVTERHMSEKQKEEKTFDVSGIPPTKILYYDPVYEFEAKVLKLFGENFVVLDQTAFYPTSGGQVHDKGVIGMHAVSEVQKIGSIIVHKITGKLKENEIVQCKVDKERRETLKKHHTATHIIYSAAKKILGDHIWQAGAEKDVDKARLDMTHYDSLSDEEIGKIESAANEIVARNMPVKTEVLPRGEAERKYGFRIYQGGIIPEKTLRIKSIGEDYEACGGIHVDSTREVGYIKILRSKRIADGMVRLEYCSGDVALNYLKEKEKLLKEIAQKLEVAEEEVPEKIQEIFNTWKQLRKK